MFWRVSTSLAPQNISVLIRVNLDAQIVSLSLENDSGNERFIWQDWVDAIMGCMIGFEERRGGEVKDNRTIVRSDLRKSALELNPFQSNTDGLIEPTSTAQIWMGWPAFDMNICKFEVEQWLAACEIDLWSYRDSTNSNPRNWSQFSKKNVLNGWSRPRLSPSVRKGILKLFRFDYRISRGDGVFLKRMLQSGRVFAHYYAIFECRFSMAANGILRVLEIKEKRNQPS